MTTISKPTLIIDESRVRENIRRMTRKIAASPGNVRFRPHFKTHQSARTGEWFRREGVTAITVSSVDMAEYFAGNGWTDITIALLVNPREIPRIDRLAESIDLQLLTDSPEIVDILKKELTRSVGVLIKIDTGYGRTGIAWEQSAEIARVARRIRQASNLSFKGLLTHAGHSYEAGSVEEIKDIYRDTAFKMQQVRDNLNAEGAPQVEISIGDTPTCSVVESFDEIDEIRCGNFVYYDIMQLEIGSCRETDIAAGLACPVIASYPDREQVVVHGGAVHLSKDYITDKDNNKIYGRVAPFNESNGTWGVSIDQVFVSSLSQEHGVLKATNEWAASVKPGDVVVILPVHSCLAVNLAGGKNNIII